MRVAGSAYVARGNVLRRFSLVGRVDARVSGCGATTLAHRLLCCWQGGSRCTQPRSIMDTFAPEFSKFWLSDATSAANDARDDDAGAQQAALQELAERVSAARSVV